MKVKPPRKILSKLKQLKSLKGASVVVGFPKGWNNYPDGTSVAMVATVHEFGSSARSIPPRPYFRPTLINNNFYKSLRIKSFKKVIDGINGNIIFNQIGSIVADDIKDGIVAVSSPALNSKTIKRKGSSNPLVDTGHLVGSVTYKVVK